MKKQQTRTYALLASFCVLLVTMMMLTTANFAEDAKQAGTIKEKLDKIFNDSKYDNAFWGVRVEDAAGNVVYHKNGQKQFMPASNMKVFTSAAVLDTLGEDYRYETRVDSLGTVRNGALNGDLIIVGSGDPSLGAWHPDDKSGSARLFAKWAREVRKAGITRVHGRIIGDGRIFTKEYYNGDWVISDVPYWYAAGTSGLAIEENAFRVYISPGRKEGDPAKLRVVPQTDYFKVVNQTKTVAAGKDTTADVVWRAPESNVIYVSGNVAIDRKTYRERGTVWNSPLYAAHMFKAALEKEGIEVGGKAINVLSLQKRELEGIDYAQRKAVVTHFSEPLSELVKQVNKISHNLFADQMYRTLAVETGRKGSYAGGAEAVKDWMKRIGVPNYGQAMIFDGSGLARRNHYQPQQMTHILRYMATKSLAKKAFYDSLPVGGVDGSLWKRMKQEGVKGKVHAKTGYIGYVRTLSGYIDAEPGKPKYIFSFMCNHYTVPTREVNESQNNACAVLALDGAE
ncbi:D-alanyl-D-alanine carboxypeptidase/D-alanyl-D-alanine endopeptidase [Poriferisphaera sp. WC338]|uniref:D-alanyl-D-alanine carboxypeptidase/D-alanyl-D-alanine endopeptidase n=1 Tax=Poriferisphaera sp. WC338 TaxID=3425129 RepID=UPI003D816BDE